MAKEYIPPTPVPCGDENQSKQPKFNMSYVERKVDNKKSALLKSIEKAASSGLRTSRVSIFEIDHVEGDKIITKANKNGRSYMLDASLYALNYSDKEDLLVVTE